VVSKASAFGRDCNGLPMDSTLPMAAAVDRRRTTPTQLRRFAYDLSARTP